MGLTLTRKQGQSLVVNDDLEIMVTQIKGKQVKITIFGDETKYVVLRGEIFNDETFRDRLEFLRRQREAFK